MCGAAVVCHKKESSSELNSVVLAVLLCFVVSVEMMSDKIPKEESRRKVCLVQEVR